MNGQRVRERFQQAGAWLWARVRAITWRQVRIALLVLALGTAAFALYLDFSVRYAFEGRRFALPAKIYARALEIYPGQKLTPEQLTQELARLDYRAPLMDESPGRFQHDGQTVELVTRPFTFWDGAQPAHRVRVRFRDGRVKDLTDPVADAEVKLLRLDPMQIGGIYPGRNEDRVLVRLESVPAHLIQALIAIEDRKYYEHHGIDPRGIARAAVATLSGRGVQGGSTLTQQLVKNFFLTPERTIKRKATEIIMAMLLELHYSKQEILETYLNEIYLGQDGNRAIHGIGLGSQFFFGKPVDQLTLTEAALLVGMVKGPVYFNPRKHPERARARRDLVLAEMTKLEMISAAVEGEARAAPVYVLERPAMGATLHPAFVDLVRRQLRRDYHDEDLRREGLQIFSTLDPVAQAAAEQALAGRLAQLDKLKARTRPLEGAVVVSDVQSGEVQALVGGRDARYQGFNRALDAQRPVGSLMKPVVFLTALAEPGRYTLATLLDDSPVRWKEPGAPEWTPQNYDKKSHGPVPLRLALAHSYNLATAHLGLDVGVGNVLDSARRLGIERELPPYASSLLGAVEITPLEMAQMYQTLAAGGFRTPLRAIREVHTADGKPLQRYGLAVVQAFEAVPVYLLTHALQDVVREGTGVGLKEYLSPALNAAGKTGTTDELRDAWFAGFTGDRVAVVWMGHDDNTPAGLTGSSGALPVWGEIMRRLDPEPLIAPEPEDIERVWTETASGLRADEDCPGALELPYARGSAPATNAACVKVAAPTPEAAPRKSWWRRLFD